MAVNILIAEDHDLVRLGFKTMLSGEKNFNIIAEVADGEACLEAVEQYKPDLLLLDLSMPKLSGMAVIAKLKKKKSGVKVVVLTAAESVKVWQELLVLGVQGIVLKSVGQAELIEGLLAVSKGDLFLHSQISSLLAAEDAVEGNALQNDDANEDLNKTKVVKLSVREKQVIKLVAEGRKTKEIADILEISDRTVSKHRENIMTKLGMDSSADLVNYANHIGLLKVSIDEIQ
ncbi:response regulator [Thiosulfativibrio zosterae]|uniref:DNA-binding response regulator n=1 Tax=Thiosulfativibrio zosterae TaxID=2675053 RepID=A0A6F8PMH7_9GAMM|nr:response regulator transcription factor [Thiosulfativibrio zosterae]BBP43295.1 DNA-binding response regulator [Thiosulfativibrio zosterae]